MRKERKRKWRCQCCNHILFDGEFLSAASPFLEDDVLIACPECRMNEGFDQLCDEDGCTSLVSGGHPMKDGYATFSGDDTADDYVCTCYKHAPKEKP